MLHDSDSTILTAELDARKSLQSWGLGPSSTPKDRAGRHCGWRWSVSVRLIGFDTRLLRAAISSKIACIEVIVRPEVSHYEHSLFQRHQTPVTRPIATVPRGEARAVLD